MRNVYFAALFENAPEAIALLDEHDNIMRINRQFTSLFGYSDDDAVGKNINDLIVPKELVEEGQKLTAQVAGGGLHRDVFHHGLAPADLS